MIRNISRKHRRRLRRRPNGAVAFGGRPIGSVFLIILYHKSLWIPVNPLPGVETNDDWVVWLTVVLVKLISETQFCYVSHSWLAFI